MNVTDAPVSPAKQDPADPPPPEPEDNEMTYEEQRLATIRYVPAFPPSHTPYTTHHAPDRANEQLLKELGLVSAPAVPRPHRAPASSSDAPKRTAAAAAGPVRKSARISAVRARETRPTVARRRPSSLTSLSDVGQASDESEGRSAGRRERENAVLPPGERLRVPVQSVRYAPGEEDYSVVQPLPRREEGGKGRLVFAGAFEGVFVPNLTPEDVLRGGAFGGNYYA